MGEGAAVFVIESEQAMDARGGTPLVWLSGYGTSSDARDIIQPDVEGAASAMRLALEDAGLDSSDIAYINAHGTGTVLNDINETSAIRLVFGDLTSSIPVSSIKQVIGHTLGASGALEFVVTIKALLEKVVPPHINLTVPDPKCDLFLPPEAIELGAGRAVMCNSFAFGGVNATLIAERSS